MHSHRHLPGVDAWGLLHFALEGVGVTDSQGEHIHAGIPLAWVRLDKAEPAAEDRGIIENLAMDVCQDNDISFGGVGVNDGPFNVQFSCVTGVQLEYTADQDIISFCHVDGLWTS